MIAIIDYGVGNLRSVEKAMHYIGAEAKITSDKDEILSADAVILPGVGAFAEAMDRLKETGLDNVIKKVISDNKPFFGICLGMQLLFDSSEEGGEMVEGLKIFKGKIKRLPQKPGLKVPHMGWNKIEFNNKLKIFNEIKDNAYFYFVHSYYLDSKQREIVIGQTEYGIKFDVAIQSGNVFATQFHPEKSGNWGIKMLENFVDIVKGTTL